MAQTKQTMKLKYMVVFSFSFYTLQKYFRITLYNNIIHYAQKTFHKMAIFTIMLEIYDHTLRCILNWACQGKSDLEQVRTYMQSGRNFNRDIIPLWDC